MHTHTTQVSLGTCNVEFRQRPLEVPAVLAPPEEGSGARATEALFQAFATRDIPEEAELLADYGPNFKITD